jgi:hypothetical protein
MRSTTFSRSTNSILIVVVGAALLAFGLGFGTGANLNALGLGRSLVATPTPLSARERFLAYGVTEAVPSHEELDAIWARWRTRGLPEWGVP